MRTCSFQIEPASYGMSKKKAAGLESALFGWIATVLMVEAIVAGSVLIVPRLMQIAPILTQ